MRILIVNNLYPPYSRGGAETAVVNEAQTLAKEGHDVAVLTTAPFKGWRSLELSEWKEEGVTVYRFFPLNLFWYRNDHKHSALVRALWYAGNLWGWHPVSIFEKAVKLFKPDAVHLHNINGMSYRYPKACDRLKVKTVFTAHAVHYAVPSGVISRVKETPKPFGLFAWLLRRMLRTEAVVTAPSRWLLDFYVSRGFFKGQKTSVIPNPLPASAAFGGETPKARPVRFLYVGQLEAYKGLNMMLAALSKLPKDIPWQIDIAGDGSLMGELRKQRDQHVSIRGKLAPEEVSRAYAQSTALIMPSLCEENAPMVIAEAQSHGLPVIASAIGGIPEMIEDGVNGMLFEPGNVEELAMHCRRAIEHPEMIESMRRACIESAKRYDPQTVAGEYLKLFGK
jgi:glycosyltransferase involved in cell wall biosynthesis